MTTITLFKRVPEVLEYYQNKFQYIHVDEYQDTNKSQYLLVQLLAKKFKNICVVGIPISLFIVGAVQTLEIFYPLRRIIQLQR